jgi:hypothetical protein
MNTATLAARFNFTLPACVLAVLQRALADPVAVSSLEKSATTWIARPLGRTVTCESGTLWLTFDHETADVILEAGQSHRCASTSKLAIHALNAARVSVN